MTRRLLCLCLPLLLGLSTCVEEAPPARFGEIRFTDEPPIRLDVARVELVSSFQPSFRAPDVEHEFPVPPQRVLEALCRDRFQAVGPASGRIARFTIEDASVREVALPRTEGIEGAFTVDQTERYDGRVAVRLEILDYNGGMLRLATAEAIHSETVDEDITANERDETWYGISAQLGRALDQKLEQQVDASFYPYKG
ncbi:MAG: hypothetical protein WCC64_07495 [Aliidongia sp.]